MNRSLVTLGLVLMMLLPSPAFAWFGWLDKLSGAGPFWGLLFDVRAVCFGQQAPDNSAGETASALAAQLELQFDRELAEARKADAGNDWERARTSYTAAESSLKATIGAYDTALKTWQNLAAAWRALVEPASKGGAIANASPQAPGRADGTNPGGQDRRPPDVDDIVKRIGELQKQLPGLKSGVDQYRTTADVYRQRNFFALTAGVEISACKEVRRRSSLDVGVGIWKVLDDGSPYVDDRMTTAKTAYTVRLFDWLDYSTSVGAFWITSSNYEAVRGVYFEPARLALHAPSSWSMLPFNNPKRIAAIPVLVWGPVVFPNGFKANAFGTPQPERIKGEAIYKNFAVFFSVHPAVRKRHTTD